MYGTNNNNQRPHFHNVPVNLNNPMLQHITMMALMSRPDIEKQLEEAINMIEGITNTIRTMRRGMESFHASMTEASRHMQHLPNMKAYGLPKKENVQQQPHIADNFNNQPQSNKFNTFPLDNTNNNSINNR